MLTNKGMCHGASSVLAAANVYKQVFFLDRQLGPGQSNFPTSANWIGFVFENDARSVREEKFSLVISVFLSRMLF